jgi:hypothetical protein
MAKYYFVNDISGLAIALFVGRHSFREAIHAAVKPMGLLQRLKTNPAHPAPIQHCQALVIPHPASGATGVSGLSAVSVPGGMPLLHQAWRIICP